MIDELEIKQQKMLLEAEYSYMWSNSYSKKHSAFGTDRCSSFSEVKDRLKYYNALETNMAERKTLISTIDALEYLKNKKDTEISLGGKLTNIEQAEYKKVCKDIDHLRSKLHDLEIRM